MNAVYSESVREGRDIFEIEHRLVRGDNGEIRFVLEKCEHVKDAEGSIVRSVGMVQDITRAQDGRGRPARVARREDRLTQGNPSPRKEQPADRQQPAQPPRPIRKRTKRHLPPCAILRTASARWQCCTKCSIARRVSHGSTLRLTSRACAHNCFMHSARTRTGSGWTAEPPQLNLAWITPYPAA
ncbi:MAG: PAS domain-containing protein [Desulfobacterales bacterium]|nr:PAS domain-containing protein [Desulfobacterales bacterium]